MSSLFPLRRSVDLDDRREPKLVDMEEETADEVFEALSAGTTRRIFAELHEEPSTASELAEAVDTSVQNVQYHLGKLDDADLVEVVDTWYSERGTEMKVYAPTDESLVVFAGGEEKNRIRDTLKRALTIVAVMLPVAGLVGWYADWLGGGTETDPGYSAETDGGGDGVDVSMESASEAVRTGTDAAGGLDPAILATGAFLLGGAFVLTLVVATVYYRR